MCSGIVKEAADVIRKRAADFGCDCHVVDDNTFELIQNTYGYIDFYFIMSIIRMIASG